MSVISYKKNIIRHLYLCIHLCHPTELKELKRLLPEMVRFEASTEDLELLKDGGVAIIDQWICAHAR